MNELVTVSYTVEKGNAPLPGPRGDEDRSLWYRAKAFHGHECPGLTIGYRAALYAKELLAERFSEDEQVVCVAENDACGCDAIQVILGCSIGKGNFLFHVTGKSAYNFFSRKTGKGIRLVLKSQYSMERDAYFQFLQKEPAEDIFEVKEPQIALPEKAKLFDNFICDVCGEKAGTRWMVKKDGKCLCLDCAEK